MAELQLSVRPREVLGKKVRAMRRAGHVPANIYGRGLESQAVQVDLLSLSHLLRSAGRNVVVSLQVEGEKAPRPVMLRGVQRQPATGQMLHVDFYQVSLTEKIRADVPLVIVGQAMAAVDLGGTLLHSLDSVSVEALPTDVPSHIEVDVSILAGFDDAIHVRDLPVDTSRVLVLSDPDLVVAKVAAPRLVAEVEEEAAAAEGAPEEAPPEAAEAAASEAEAGEEKQ